MWTWEMLIDALRKAEREEDAINEATSFRCYLEGVKIASALHWHYRVQRILADLLVDAGRLDEAVSEYEEALHLAENWWGQDDEDTIEVRAILAQLRS